MEAEGLGRFVIVFLARLFPEIAAGYQFVVDFRDFRKGRGTFQRILELEPKT